MNQQKICTALMGFALYLTSLSTNAQNPFTGNQPTPIKITLFSESIGLPNFSRFFKQSGFGVKIGTEFYYANKKNHQFFQTANVGFYSHKNFSTAFFLSTEAGYRKYFGAFFTDATLGGGIQLSKSATPVYKPSENGYVKSNGQLVRFTPVIGIGTGYCFSKTAVVARYEMFGEMPFGYQGVAALPHQTIHLGANFHF